MIAPDWYPNEKKLRLFSVTALFGFGLIGLVIRLKFGLEVMPYALWGVGALTFLLGITSPRSVHLLYVILQAITLPIGWLISQIALRLMFYCVLTPLGLLFRLIGRDPLILRRPSSAETYWLEHTQRNDPSSYFRQY